MEAPPEPGAVLLLQLGSPPGPRATHARLARVIHSAEEPGGAWLVGCRFTPPLSEAELATLAQRYARYA